MNKTYWIKETNDMVKGYKANGRPVTYVLPALDNHCSICKVGIEDYKPTIFEFDGKKDRAFCSDEHWVKYWDKKDSVDNKILVKNGNIW